MKFKFHNSYVILELVARTVISWTDLLSQKLPQRCSCLEAIATKKSTVVITICLIVRKYPYLKWQCIFYFFRISYLSSITANTLQSWQYIWVTRRLSHKKMELLTLREHLISSPVFGGVHVAHFVLVFVLFCYVSLRSEFWVHWCPFVFTPSCLSYMYLRYLCLFSYNSVLHIFCFCFVFFVFCTLCCQFLLIDHFLLPFFSFFLFFAFVLCFI